MREVLAPPVPELVRPIGPLDLRVRGRRAAYPWLGYPEGIDELSFRESGVVTDVGHLVSLFELFDVLLPRLDPAVRGYEEDVDLLVRRLTAPGGRVQAPGTNLLLWDGDAPRRDAGAVEPLISVLEDDDEALVVASAEALMAVVESENLH